MIPDGIETAGTTKNMWNNRTKYILINDFITLCLFIKNQTNSCKLTNKFKNADIIIYQLSDFIKSKINFESEVREFKRLFKHENYFTFDRPDKKRFY
jgi:hypothetical protein